MLKYMRDNTGSWIIKILLGLIVVVFVFLGMGSMQSSRGNKVAVVNDKPITFDEFQRSYQAVMGQMRQQFGDNLTDEMLEMLQVKRQAIDTLINEQLVADQAEKLKIKVSDAELKQSILAVPVFRRNGNFDLETYKRVLASNQWTPEMFEQIQRKSLKQEKVRQLVLNSVTVSDLEAGEYYRYNNSAVGVDYLVFKPEDVKNVDIDEEMMKTHYEANKNKYRSEPMLRVKYLEFNPDDYKGKVSYTEEKLRAYYDDNPVQFKVQARVEARHVLIATPDSSDDAVEKARVKADEVYKKAMVGEDFGELAKTYSEGPSKDSGGYLGFFSREAMVKPFSDKAFSMKPGEISEPVKSEFGWHVIKVESSFPEAVTDFENAKDDIKLALESDALKNLAYNDASVAFDAIIEGDDLDQAALLVDKSVFEAGPFPRQWQGTTVVADSEKFAEAAFELPVDGLSDVIQLQDSYYIIQPVEKFESKPMEFEIVRHRVLKELTASKKHEQAIKNAEDVLAGIKENESMAEVAKEKGLSLQSTQLFTRTSKVAEFEKSPGVVEAAFTLSEKNPVYSEVVQGGDGYYLVALKEQEEPRQDEIQKNMDSVKMQMRQAKEARVYTAWLTELRNNAVIEIEEDFLN